MADAPEIPDAETVTVAPDAAVAVAAAAAEQDAAVSAGGVRVFPLLVIMLAVFPLAIGIGFTLQTVTPPPGKLDAAEKLPPAVPNRIEPRLTGLDRSAGDDLLREGRYETALHHYRSLGSADSLRASPELAMKMAMCQEGLGLWEDALAAYRSVAGSRPSVVTTSAILGQSRVWIRLKDFAAAEPLLRSLVMQSGNRELMPHDAIAEVTLLYSIVLAEQTLTHSEQPATAGLVPVGNLLEWSFGDAVKWADAKSPGSLSATTDAAPATETDAASLRITVPGKPEETDKEPVPADVRGGHNPLAEPLQLVARQQSVAQILSRIAGECGWKLEWSDVLQARATARVVDATVQDLPLRVVLSALCRDLGCRWEFQRHKEILVVSEMGEGTDADRHQCEDETEDLKAMLAFFPGHRLSGPAKFALGQLAAADGRFGDAAQIYSSLTGKTSSPLAIHAAFNAALAYHCLGDMARTCQSLEVVVHGAPGHALHTRSLVLYGRALMDRGEFREAAYQLKRAADSHDLPEEQARAAVFLSMAQLLDGKPHDAAESLFVHRLQFQDRTVRNAAALMTSIARWRTATGPSKNREAAFLYRSIAAVAADSDWLGPIGQLLLGQAMCEADLNDQMAELYSHALEQGVSPVVSVQMKLALAGYWYTHDRTADAKAIWLELSAAGGAVAVSAGLRLAELALDERQPEKCLELCRALQRQLGVSRTDLLKLAGRAHELAGHPVLAAQCYAGQWPLP